MAFNTPKFLTLNYEQDLMKLYSLLFVFSLFTYQQAEAGYCRSERTLSAAEQIANLDPKFDLDLVDLDLFPGGSVVAGYEYEVEPAYTDGLYSRSDSWQIGMKAIPGRDFGSTRLSLGVQTKTEATFIRFFKDPCKAMTAKPYSPKHIPMNAKRALSSRFDVGDYFLFRGSMGFVASSEIFSMLSSSFWGAGLSGSYLMEGFYQLHVVRLNENEIRLKVIAHRGKTLGASFGLGYENEFTVFGIEILNDQLERFVNTKPIKVNANIGHAKVFMVDYVLNLTDPEVAEAFNELLPQAKDFRNLNLLAQFKNGIDEDLLLDLTGLENIYRRDFEAGSVSRLKRNLRTTSDQRSYGFGLDVGNKILGFELDRGNSSSNMSIPRANDFMDRYVLESWEKKVENRFLYSWRKTKNNQGLRTLYRADSNFKNLEPINVVRFINQKKNRLTYKHFNKMKLSLKKSLPREVFAKIPWEQWQQKPNEKHLNFGLRYELVLAPEVFLNVPELSEKEIKVLFKDYLASKGLEAHDFFAGIGNSDDEDNEQFEESTYEEDNEIQGFIPEITMKLSLRKMARKLSRALDRNLPFSERIEHFNDLRTNKLFHQAGVSFLLSFNPDKTQYWYNLDLNISSNQSKIDFTYGDRTIAELYKKIITIKAALDDEGLDLIREAESLSIPLSSYLQ